MSSLTAQKRMRGVDRCTVRIPKRLLAAARRILRTRSATETVERALDLVVFPCELIRGSRTAFGIHIDPTGP